MHLMPTICWILLLCFIPYTESYRLSGWLPKPAYGSCKAEQREPWSYRGRNGPKFWGKTYPQCYGNEQSPIAISSREADPDWDLPKLSMNNYDIPISKANIENNGHTVQLTPTDDVSRTIVAHGSTYRLVQLHFHWGDSYYRGSEHTVDGTHYSMEMHLVHQNSDDEIAVVGVFFQEQSSENAELQHIIDEFPKVLYKNTSTQLRTSVNLNHLVPENPSSFYRYDGSLTTPDCAEGVTWSVLTDSLPVGHNQMAQFRKLYTVKKSDANSKCKMSNNYRPIQPLNQRTVYISQ